MHLDIMMDAVVDFLVCQTKEHNPKVCDHRQYAPSLNSMAILYRSVIVYVYGDGMMIVLCDAQTKFRGTMNDPDSLDALLACIQKYEASQ